MIKEWKEFGYDETPEWTNKGYDIDSITPDETGQYPPREVSQFIEGITKDDYIDFRNINRPLLQIVDNTLYNYLNFLSIIKSWGKKSFVLYGLDIIEVLDNTIRFKSGVVVVNQKIINYANQIYKGKIFSNEDALIEVNFTDLKPDTFYYIVVDIEGKIKAIEETPTDEVCILGSFKTDLASYIISDSISDLRITFESIIKEYTEKYQINDIVISTQAEFEDYFGTGEEDGEGFTKGGFRYSSDDTGRVSIYIPANTKIYLKSNPPDGVITHSQYNEETFNIKAYKLNSRIVLGANTQIIGANKDSTIIFLGNDWAKIVNEENKEIEGLTTFGFRLYLINYKGDLGSGIDETENLNYSDSYNLLLPIWDVGHIGDYNALYIGINKNLNIFSVNSIKLIFNVVEELRITNGDVEIAFDYWNGTEWKECKGNNSLNNFKETGLVSIEFDLNQMNDWKTSLYPPSNMWGFEPYEAYWVKMYVKNWIPENGNNPVIEQAPKVNMIYLDKFLPEHNYYIFGFKKDIEQLDKWNLDYLKNTKIFLSGLEKNERDLLVWINDDNPEIEYYGNWERITNSNYFSQTAHKNNTNGNYLHYIIPNDIKQIGIITSENDAHIKVSISDSNAPGGIHTAWIELYSANPSQSKIIWIDFNLALGEEHLLDISYDGDTGDPPFIFQGLVLKKDEGEREELIELNRFYSINSYDKEKGFIELNKFVKNEIWNGNIKVLLPNIILKEFTIDGNKQNRIIETNGGCMELSGIYDSKINIKIINSKTKESGGAIYIKESSNFSIDKIINCEATRGGGVYTEYCEIFKINKIERCRGWRGGGLYSLRCQYISPINIYNCSATQPYIPDYPPFEGNYQNGGGGVYGEENLFMKLKILNCKAKNKGGGVYLKNSEGLNLDVSGCYLEAEDLFDGGGGIFIYNQIKPLNSIMKISKCSISGGKGAALWGAGLQLCKIYIRDNISYSGESLIYLSGKNPNTEEFERYAYGNEIYIVESAINKNPSFPACIISFDEAGQNQVIMKKCKVNGTFEIRPAIVLRGKSFILIKEISEDREVTTDINTNSFSHIIKDLSDGEGKYAINGQVGDKLYIVHTNYNSGDLEYRSDL